MEALIFNIQRFSLHDGDGIRTNVFFQGCNLSCLWCANPESQPLSPCPEKSGARLYSTDTLVKELLKDKPFYDRSNGGVTLTGGEPLLQPAFVDSLCDALRKANVNVALETAACVPSGVFRLLMPKLDAIYIDLKHYDDEAHRGATGAGNAQIIENIRYALESSIRTVIRIPVIPGYNDSVKDRPAFATLLKALGAKLIHLLPFHQMGEGKYRQHGLLYAFDGVPQLHDEDMEPFAQVLRESGIETQIGG